MIVFSMRMTILDILICVTLNGCAVRGNGSNRGKRVPEFIMESVRDWDTNPVVVDQAPINIYDKLKILETKHRQWLDVFKEYGDSKYVIKTDHGYWLFWCKRVNSDAYSEIHLVFDMDGQLVTQGGSQNCDSATWWKGTWWKLKQK